MRNHERRLERLESRTPSAARHGPVSEVIDQGHRRTHRTSCRCGHPGCAQCPTLVVITPETDTGDDRAPLRETPETP
jgi:hypothetical protein